MILKRAFAFAFICWGLFVSVASADLTIVLDFNDASQGTTSDVFGDEVGTFDVTGFGFASSQNAMVQNAILQAVEGHFHGIATSGVNGFSPIPDGQELAIDFLIGDIGSNPGTDEFYFLQIGSDLAGNNPLGQAGLSIVRTASGVADPSGQGNGFVFGSVWADNINGIGGVGNALTSGNLDATVNALAGTISHEIGHALSLGHIRKAGSVTHSGASPLMGTGAVDLPNIDRISAREFSFSGFDSDGNPLNHVSQLVSAVGLRSVTAVPEPGSALILSFVFVAASFRRRKSA